MLTTDPTTTFSVLSFTPIIEPDDKVYYDKTYLPNGKYVIGRVVTRLSKKEVEELIKTQYRESGVVVTVELYDDIVFPE